MEKNKGPEVDGTGGVRVDRPVRRWEDAEPILREFLELREHYWESSRNCCLGCCFEPYLESLNKKVIEMLSAQRQS